MGFPKISCLKNNQRDGGSREKVDCKTMSARRAEIKKSDMKIYLSWKDTYMKIYPLWKDSYPIQTKIHFFGQWLYIPPKTHFLSKLHALCALCELSRNSIVTSLPRVVCPIQRNNWECSCSYCTNDNSCLVNIGLSRRSQFSTFTFTLLFGGIKSRFSEIEQSFRTTRSATLQQRIEN